MDLSLRKSVLLGVLLGLVLLAAIPSVVELWRSVRDLPAYVASWKAREQEKAFMRPPAKLPIRPDDYRRFPRQGFGFIIDHGRWFRVDSFQGTLTTVVRSGRDTTIAFAFTDAEIDSIYRAMIALRIFDIEEPYPTFTTKREPGTHGGGGSRTIEIRAGSASKHFFVHYPAYVERIVGASDNWKRLNKWTYLIEQVAMNDDRVRRLPKPVPKID